MQRFKVVLKDPFGTISGGGEITMDAGSVFEAGVAAGLALEGTTLTAVAEPLTAEERAGQILQITGEKYVQRSQMPWFIELSEVT